MSSFVSARRSVSKYAPFVGVKSLSNICRIGFALLSHVRLRFVTVGDVRAVTIADADEKLFMCWHTLCRVNSCDTPANIKTLHLCGIDPFLIHLHPPFQVTRPVRMGQSAISDLM
jgi:hypothetical protein